MSVYAFSDLHGNGILWDKIKSFLGEDDKAYFLGDACDRGPDGWRILKEILADERIVFLCYILLIDYQILNIQFL